jgi:hypothetical protein
MLPSQKNDKTANMTFSAVCIIASGCIPAQLVPMPQLSAYVLPAVLVLVYDQSALMSGF